MAKFSILDPKRKKNKTVCRRTLLVIPNTVRTKCCKYLATNVVFFSFRKPPKLYYPCNILLLYIIQRILKQLHSFLGGCWQKQIALI